MVISLSNDALCTPLLCAEYRVQSIYLELCLTREREREILANHALRASFLVVVAPVQLLELDVSEEVAPAVPSSDAAEPDEPHLRDRFGLLLDVGAGRTAVILASTTEDTESDR